MCHYRPVTSHTKHPDGAFLSLIKILFATEKTHVISTVSSGENNNTKF